jgi:quinol-cytochrome oxidoreductase complex cytochrome b subunit
MERTTSDRWVDRALGWDLIKSKFLYKPVSSDIGWLYTLGSLAIFLFTLQAATGIILACNYVPTLEGAHTSVEYIQREMAWGWLIRGLHHWGSSAMVLVVFVHLLRVFFHSSYKKPNEVTWITGLVLLLFTAAMALTGYILPWTGRSYWASTILATTLQFLPVLGSWLVNVVGGVQAGGLTIRRYSAFHMLLIPSLLFFVIVVHILLIQLHGETGPPPKREPARMVPFFPGQVTRDVVAAVGMFALLALLARFVGVPYEAPAAPLAPLDSVPKPEWFLLFGYEILKMFTGRSIIIALTVLPAVGALVLLLLPFYDRNPDRAYSKRPLAIASGVTGVLAIVYLTLVAYVSSPLPGRFFAPDRRLTVQELAGAALFERSVCYSCHSIRGVGMKHAPDLWYVGLKHDRAWFKALLTDPDATLGVKGAMVTYHMSPADMDALAAYLTTIDFRHSKVRTLDPPRFRGAYAFYDGGCLACHRLGGEGTGDDRLSAASRPRGEALVRYLTADEKHRSLMTRAIPTDAAERIAAFLEDGTRDGGTRPN